MCVGGWWKREEDRLLKRCGCLYRSREDEREKRQRERGREERLITKATTQRKNEATKQATKEGKELSFVFHNFLFFYRLCFLLHVFVFVFVPLYYISNIPRSPWY